MTHGLTWAELDRLADYTVDALDPADAAQIATSSHRPALGCRSRARCVEAEARTGRPRRGSAMAHPMPDDVAAADRRRAATRRLRPARRSSLSTPPGPGGDAWPWPASPRPQPPSSPSCGGISLNAGLIRTDAASGDGGARRKCGWPRRAAAPVPAESADGADPGSATRCAGIRLRHRLPARTPCRSSPSAGTHRAVRTQAEAQDGARRRRSPPGAAPDALARLTDPSGLA